MAARKAKADPFTAHVSKVAKEADRDALSVAVRGLVVARLSKRTECRAASERTAERIVADNRERMATQRRKPRRLGRFRAYTVTAKPDVSRLGTFRHYMLTTIRKHTNTRDANAEHATCDVEAWAKNKLDFNWAADNGYITFD